MPNTINRTAEFLEAVLDNAGALVVVLDRDGRIRRFNRACEALSGYSFADVEGKFPWETFLPPEEAEAVHAYSAGLMTTSPQAGPNRHINHWLGKNGQRALTEWSNTLLSDDQGRTEFIICIGRDITERQCMEDALRDSEAWLRQTQAIADVGSWELDHLNDFLKWSEETHRIFGVAPKEFASSYPAFLQRVHPDDRGRVDQAYRAAVRDRLPYEVIHRIIRPDGEVRWVHERGETRYDESGKALRTIGAVQDITRRKQTEDSLRASNQLNAAVLDTTPVLIAYLDRDMNFVRVNRAYAEVDGKTPDDFVGKNHFALYPNAENETIFRRVLETGVAYRATARPFEYEHNPERGLSHWDWTLTPIRSPEGKVEGLVLSLLDVTDRIQAIESAQRSELALRQLNESLEASVQARTAEVQRQAQRSEAIINTAFDGFFSTDGNGRILAANPAFCTMLGYGEGELLQMSVPDIEANEDPAAVAAHIEKIIRFGHDRFDTRHRRQDGSLIDVEMNVTCVELGGERIFYGYAHDISPRKATEAALVRAHDEAERANRAKSEFLSRMSHELRTPLNAILGFGQLLELENLPAMQAENVREIMRAGRHLLELINEILDLSRIESGHVELSLEPVELLPLVNECLAMVKPLAAQRRIRLEMSPAAGNARHAALADRVRLRQILINLLSNALKYNHEDGHVRIDFRKNPDGFVRLAVEDSGYGIDAESLQRLFRPFERLESPYAGIEGSGIGLALAKRLTEAMGGKIGVDSEVGVGSTFWIELPAAEAAAGHAVAESGKTAPESEGKHRGTILYVEDNPTNLRLMRQIIEKDGDLRMLDAMTAEIGLAMAKAAPPDLILMDINLPGMNGHEALQVLRADPITRDIPIIAITANAMKRDYEHGLEEGFDDYVTKPLDVENLTKLLRLYLESESGAFEEEAGALDR